MTSMAYSLSKHDDDLIKQAFARLLPEYDVYIFGSRANGSCHERSDIDLLAIHPTGKLPSSEEHYLINREMALADVPVDLLFWHKIPEHFKKNIVNNPYSLIVLSAVKKLKNNLVYSLLDQDINKEIVSTAFKIAYARQYLEELKRLDISEINESLASLLNAINDIIQCRNKDMEDPEKLKQILQNIINKIDIFVNQELSTIHLLAETDPKTVYNLKNKKLIFTKN